jgi:hypothetical protein
MRSSASYFLSELIMRVNRKRTISILVALFALFTAVPAALAHPLGNFTISR